MAGPRPQLSVTSLRYGSPRELPLVLLHGFTGDATTFSRFSQRLGTERDVLALDLIGHGTSPKPDEPAHYTMSAAVEQVADTLLETGVDRAHWLGYSMGGRVALHLALAHPESIETLTLVSASPGIADPDARARRRADDEALASFVEQEGVAAFVERWMAHPLFASQARLGSEYLAEARSQRLRCSAVGLAHSLRGMGVGSTRPLHRRLGELVAPTLVVAGERDPKFRRLAKEMVARLPRGELRIVAAAGHAVHVEAPAALAGEFMGFVSRSREDR